MRLLFLVTVAIAVVGLAGCNRSTVGESRPNDSGGATGSTSKKPPVRQVRPREVRLDRVEPCLVPPADFAKLHIEKPGESVRAGGAWFAPECLYEAGEWSLVVALVMSEGVSVFIDAFNDGSGAAVPEEVAPVAGFPAITLTLPGYEHSCDVAVDVAAGQFLLASVALTEKTPSQELDVCDFARALAELAMAKLVGA